MKAIVKKELNFYFNTVNGYIPVALFAIFANFLFVKDLFAVGTVSFSNFFSFLPWILLIFIPALAMRIFSEEKRRNTLEVLLSLPLEEKTIVLGKFFALSLILLISIFLTFPAVFVIAFITKAYLPEIFVGYFGVILLSLAFLSFCFYVSSKTDSQIVAFLASVLILFFLLVFSSDFVASYIPENLLRPVNFLFPLINYEGFGKGLISLSSVFYFISFLFLFLFLTVLELEKRE